MSNKKIPLPEDYLKQIETMAGLGLNLTQTAALLGMSKVTFERRLKKSSAAREALEKGRSLAALNVTKTAYSLAVSGKVPAMTMFWLKCRERWKEVSVHELTGTDGKPIETLSKLDDSELDSKIQKLMEKRNPGKEESGA